jgi:cell division protein FtsQ
MDLADLRTRVEGVGWVKSPRSCACCPTPCSSPSRSARRWPSGSIPAHAGDRRRGPDDPRGRPARFPQLPLVVGQGADQAAGAILPAVAARPRLRDRLEALVRVDDRRWDLRLKDGSLIQLPAIDEESALIQLDQLDQRQRILDLGFARIDLRDPEMVAVRPRDAALPGQPVAGGACMNLCVR